MTVDVERSGAIATITLNRPEALNAITQAMRRQLITAWCDLDGNPEIRAIVLTGAGDRAFSAGADLKETAPLEAAAVGQFGYDSNYLLEGFPVRTPTICAINGYAIGGGLELALACDIRIASETAKFGLSEVRTATIPGGGGTQLLPRTVGRSLATYMALTGDHIDARRALTVGLVSEITSGGALMNRTAHIAEQITANGPLAVRAVRELVSTALDVPLAEGLRAERLAWGLIRDTEDRREGREAFAAGRSPKFMGR